MKETKPVSFPEANVQLNGRTKEDALPIYETVCPKRGKLSISCWKIPLWRRIKLLFSGKIWLCVKGPHPAVFIETEVFEKRR